MSTFNIDAIRNSWCEKTSAMGVNARSGCPHGQCAVTALLVQDIVGGVLLRAEIEHPDGRRESHYWNLIPAVGELDLTREQYDAALVIPRGAEVPRSRLLEGPRAATARTLERYELLRDRYFDIVKPNWRTET